MDGILGVDAEGFPILAITAPDCDHTCISCQAGDHAECGVGCHTEVLTCFICNDAIGASQARERALAEALAAGGDAPLSADAIDLRRQLISVQYELTAQQQYARRLAEALEWYADSENWGYCAADDIDAIEVISWVGQDYPHPAVMARAALAHAGEDAR